MSMNFFYSLEVGPSWNVSEIQDDDFSVIIIL